MESLFPGETAMKKSCRAITLGGICSGPLTAHAKPTLRRLEKAALASLSHSNSTEWCLIKTAMSSASRHSQTLLVTLSFPSHSLFKDLLTRSATIPAEICPTL